MKIKNLPLVVGLALPIVFIVMIWLVLFIPALLIKPEHNFLYTDHDDPYGYIKYKHGYQIEGGRLVMVQRNVASTSNVVIREAPTLYLYDVVQNATHQISFDEAKNLALDPGPTSPDGYSVGYYYGNDGIFELFGSGGDSNGYFIGKGSARRELRGLASFNGRYGYQGALSLLGWVK